MLTRYSDIESKDPILFCYQEEMKHHIFTKWDTMNNIMVQMPTGTGKTILFASIVRDIRNWIIAHQLKSHVLILAHVRELIQQAADKLQKRGIDCGIILSGIPQNLDKVVQVASIQTFMSSKNKDRMAKERFDFIIIDEAHHSMAPRYQDLWELFPDSKKLGVTATPWRMDHSGFTTIYEGIVISHPIEWFVREGYLSNYDYISIALNSDIQHEINSIDRFGVDGDYLEEELINRFDKDSIRAKLYESYHQFCKGKKGIIYAINRQHAANIKCTYQSYGVNIDMIDGTTPKSIREALLADFKVGNLQVIVNVNIFSEGFDCPDIEFIQLARPTKSLAMFLQQIGRGLRTAEGKEKGLILDNVGLYNRFGTPMANRRWHYHFIGHETDTYVYNDGSGIMRDIIFEERNLDYSEGDEQMTLVEHAEGGRQIRSTESEDSNHGIGDYNVFKKHGKYGICSRNNRTIIPPIYEDMHPYYKGYIPFKQNGKWGIMLGVGVIKIKPKYYFIGAFEDGKAMVQNTKYSEQYFINDKLERI
jgi:superfamily II DNA or RNA helicase